MATKEEVKVFGFWVSPFSHRVEWALKLKGVDYEYIEEDIYNKSSLLTQVLNPVHKRVPVLVHDHKVINESMVILEYIDETWKGKTPLLPQDPYKRATARFWADVGNKKILEGAWGAMCLKGDEKKSALELCMESFEKLEEELKSGICSNLIIGGENENIGYLDIALGWISYWLPVWEELGNVKILDPIKFPATASWIDNFLKHPVIKEKLPSREKMIVYFRKRSEEFLSSFEAAKKFD